MFLNVRFLLAAQAVETLHRETIADTVIPEDDHAKLVETLVAAMPSTTPKAMREKLLGTLGYSNELSLRQRLKALIKIASDGFSPAPFGYDSALLARS